MPRGIKIEKLLETLKDGVMLTGELLDVFLTTYPDSYRKLRTISESAPVRRNRVKSAQKSQNQRFYALLNQLKRNGLVQKNKRESGAIWKITKRGLAKLRLLRENREDIGTYMKKKDKKFKIVIFDIPEEERHKRSWLRSVLVSLDFNLLQKSVWIGKNKIPERLLHDLRRKSMLEYVHIFEVSKKGTVEKFF